MDFLQIFTDDSSKCMDSLYVKIFGGNWAQKCSFLAFQPKKSDPKMALAISTPDLTNDLF